MNITRAPAASGLAWFRESLRLFARRPLSLSAGVGAGFVFELLLNLVPLAGPVLAALAWPTAALGMMACCRAAQAGQVPTLAQYLEGPRQTPVRRQLLLLGAAYTVLSALLLLFVHAVGLDAALRLAVNPAPAMPRQMPPLPMALLAVISMPLTMAMLLAPTLVGWHQLPAVKAMFFSFFACWRNRWPLLVFVAAAAGLTFVTIVLAGSLAALAGTDAQSAAIIIAPLGLAVLSLFQCGSFRMYSQVVQASAALAPH